MAGPAKVSYLGKRHPALSRADFPTRWRQNPLFAGSMPMLIPAYFRVAQCLNAWDRTMVARASLEYNDVSLLFLSDRSFAQTIWTCDLVRDLVLPEVFVECAILRTDNAGACRLDRSNAGFFSNRLPQAGSQNRAGCRSARER